MMYRQAVTKVGAAIMLIAYPILGLTADITRLSEAEFDAQFRCPETFVDEQHSQLALAEFVAWYGAHHKEVTVESLTTYRMHLLNKHKCEVTLANIRQSSETPPQAVPEYNARTSCSGNARCVDGEMAAKRWIQQNWASISGNSKTYCLSASTKAHNTSYRQMRDCLVYEDKRR
ncbi:MAG: hypothetical protein EPO09_19015 [Aquabacterium sp.]|uniref:hypothetical protein n=1 Tax=Aquabacterium sp. TaxID=1872578 RepID=UPI001202D715|nr:hypothetical protein [Aquabacterium sp.]TAK87084.1 MAG: hypothetical protein EPO09_19015 [Aquabacterium sp.]